MKAGQLAMAVAVAAVLYILVPTLAYPAFYAFLSPYFGCTPLGNGEALFTSQALIQPQVSGLCKGSAVYEGLLIYFSVITLLLSIGLFFANRAMPVLVIGVMLPNIYFAVAGLFGMVFEGLAINIVSIIIIIAGIGGVYYYA